MNAININHPAILEKIMTTAEQIAQKLFEDGIRFNDCGESCALVRASEATKTEVVKMYFAASKVRHDEFVTAMGDHLSEPEWFPFIGDPAELGRVVENALYAYIEQVAGDDIDEELWFLQQIDVIEQKSINRGIRESLPAMLGVA